MYVSAKVQYGRQADGKALTSVLTKEREPVERCGEDETDQEDAEGLRELCRGNHRHVHVCGSIRGHEDGGV